MKIKTQVLFDGTLSMTMPVIRHNINAFLTSDQAIINFRDDAINPRYTHWLRFIADHPRIKWCPSTKFRTIKDNE